MVRIFIVTLLCVGLLLLVPRLVGAVVGAIALPINATKTWLMESNASFPQYFRDRSMLIKEVNDLKGQLATERSQRSTIDQLMTENKTLRGLLGDHGETRILAGIIGRPGTMPYDTLLLDRGSADGIVLNAPVYIGDSTVIGSVQNVTAHTALVELITSPGFKATVYVMGPNIYTDAVGQGGGQLRVGIPQGLPVKEGDTVVLPAVSSGVFGTISTIENAPEQPEQYGYVSPKLSLGSIRFVAVGTVPMHSVTFSEAADILKNIKTNYFVVPMAQTVVHDPNASSSKAAVSTSTTASTTHHD